MKLDMRWGRLNKSPDYVENIKKPAQYFYALASSSSCRGHLVGVKLSYSLPYQYLKRTKAPKLPFFSSRPCRPLNILETISPLLKLRLPSSIVFDFAVPVVPHTTQRTILYLQLGRDLLTGAIPWALATEAIHGWCFVCPVLKCGTKVCCWAKS